MTRKITRRGVLTLAGSAAVMGLAATVKSATAPENADIDTSGNLPDPANAPFDTVVVLMMENRSFDHVLGLASRREWPAAGPDVRRQGRRRTRDLAARAGFPGLRLRGP